MIEDQACRLCLYWSEDPGDYQVGYCCRYPPTIVPDPDRPSGRLTRRDIFGETQFPVTDRNEWCGEWKEREEQGSDERTE